MKKFKVAVIGYGRSGRDIHKNIIDRLPDMFEIVAHVDADAERRDMIKAESKPEVEVLSDYTELFGKENEIDFVVNASFSKEHAPISIDLLNHGFNVLSEKPTAYSSEKLKEIFDTAEKNGKFFFPYQQYRYSPAYKKIKEIVDSGVLGRLVQVRLSYGGFGRRWDWQTVQAYMAGSLFNTGPHPVDQGLDFMNFPEDVKVNAIFDRATTYGDAEDYAKVILTAKDAPVVDIEVTSTNAYNDYTYLVQGTNGTLKGGEQTFKWKYFVTEEAPKQELTTVPLRNEKGEPIYCREALPFKEFTWEIDKEAGIDNDKGIAFYKSFYKKLTEGAPMLVTLDHIYKQIKIIEEAHRQNDDILKPFI